MVNQGLDPDPWQRDVLTSNSTRLMMLCCRQSGKSTTTAALAVNTIIDTPGALVVLTSPSLPQSQEIFRKILKGYQAVPERPNAIRETTTELELSNGARVVCKSSNAATIRSFSAVHTVIVDEAALADDDLFTAVSPMLAVSGGRFILLSSPKGQRGFFHEQWESSPLWEKVKVQAELCPRITPEFLESELATMGSTMYAQEYNCHLPSTRVRMASGATSRIDSLAIGDRLLYNDLSTLTVKVCQVKEVRMTGDKEIAKVRTELGTTFAASESHGVRTRSGKAPLCEADELHYVYHATYSSGRDEARARVVAFSMGDGTIVRRASAWVRKDGTTSGKRRPQASWYSDFAGDLERLATDLVAAELCDKPPTVLLKKGNGTQQCPDIFQVHGNRETSEACVELGCPVGKKKLQRFDVPSWIFDGPESVQREFVASLFGSEGNTPFHPEKSSARLCVAPHLTMWKERFEDGQTFFAQLETMLGNLGIKASYSARAGKSGIAFRLAVGGTPENIRAFFAMIGYRYAAQKEMLAFQWASYISSYLFEAHDRRARIARLRKDGWRWGSIDRLLHLNSGHAKILGSSPVATAGHAFPHFAEWIESRWADNGIYARIIRAKSYEKQPCLNIEVDSPDHSYLLADGVDNFNCEFLATLDQYFRTEDIDRAFISTERALFDAPVYANGTNGNGNGHANGNGYY